MYGNENARTTFINSSGIFYHAKVCKRSCRFLIMQMAASL